MVQSIKQCDVCHKAINDVKSASVAWVEKVLWGKTECDTVLILHDTCMAQLQYQNQGVCKALRSLPLEYMLHHKTAKMAAKIMPGLEKCFDELLRIGELCGFDSGKKKF